MYLLLDTTTLISYLDNKIRTSDDTVSVGVMLKEVNFSKDTWKNMKKGKNFLINLHMAGYDIERVSYRKQIFVKIEPRDY